MSRLVGPTIEVESAHGVREVSLDTRHLMNRRIFIHGEIDDDSANDFLSQMLYLEQESDEPITIYINSPGGQVDAGLLIYDCIQSCDVEVNIVCAGIQLASIRSRGISTMLMVQAESQLASSYGDDWATIIGNCDTYVYLCGNDVKTAQAVAERADVPMKKVLNMPVGTNWIFRRGQAPVFGKNFDLETYLKDKFGEEKER